MLVKYTHHGTSGSRDLFFGSSRHGAPRLLDLGKNLCTADFAGRAPLSSAKYWWRIRLARERGSWPVLAMRINHVRPHARPQNEWLCRGAAGRRFSSSAPSPAEDMKARLLSGSCSSPPPRSRGSTVPSRRDSVLCLPPSAERLWMPRMQRSRTSPAVRLVPNES